jgi:hypothetical protein
MVVEVRNENVAVGGHRDAAGRAELARSASGAAERALRRAVEGEHLDAVVEVLGHVELAVANVEVHGATQFAHALADASELALEIAIEVEHLNAPVAGIRHEHLSARHGDARRIVELAGPRALLAPRFDERVGGLLGGRDEDEAAERGKRGQDDKRPSRVLADPGERHALPTTRVSN